MPSKQPLKLPPHHHKKYQARNKKISSLNSNSPQFLTISPPTPAGVALRNAAPKLPGNGQLSVPPDIFRRTSQVPPSPSPHTAIALPAGHQIAHQSRPWPPALNNCRPPGFMANYHAPLHCAPFLPGLKHWILPCHPKSPPARPRHVPAQNRSGTNMSPALNAPHLKAVDSAPWRLALFFPPPLSTPPIPSTLRAKKMPLPQRGISFLARGAFKEGSRPSCSEKNAAPESGTTHCLKLCSPAVRLTAYYLRSSILLIVKKMSVWSVRPITLMAPGP